MYIYIIWYIMCVCVYMYAYTKFKPFVTFLTERDRT